MTTTSATLATDARHLTDLHAAAVTADRHAGQDTTAATVQASLAAHREPDEACEAFRRRHFPRSRRVVAAYGEVFTLSSTGVSIRLVWSDR